MSSLARRPFLHRIARSAAAVALAAPLAAAGALHVYEPFDYAAPSLLDGTPANGVNLAGPYVSDAIDAQYQLRISTPGLSYGQLTGAPGFAAASSLS